MILKITNLSKRFGRRWLFRNITFDAGPGDSIAITGSNGSGKSTLVRLIAGVLTPTSGSVTLDLDGTTIPDEEHCLNMGFVGPYLQLYDGLTLRENLRFVQRVRGLRRDDQAIDAAVEQVGLGGRADDLVSTYSSGMKQRARFSVVLVVNPPILIFDEPGSNLDDAGVSIVRDLVRNLISEGKTVIVATNSAEERDWCSARLDVEDFKPTQKGR